MYVHTYINYVHTYINTHERTHTHTCTYTHRAMKALNSIFNFEIQLKSGIRKV